MKLAILLTAFSLFQVTLSFAPSPNNVNGARTSSELFLFGSNKKANTTPKVVKKQKKTVEKKKKSTGDGWKKFARIAVTGSPDGISLLGKPQHDWVSGKALDKPKSHSWTTSYKETDGRKKK